ncbi:MAG TPA: polysaccharide biosynthesis/export family protein [Candidatus Tripitaka californicus]|uniref:polysaccharide biosynthesis/export family protein n=1 Tax=Candidatus Tripitaka californicus TaxID=3367616 RepID=UPI0040255873|nr:polysaccharide biosynthesis/export family protein [Planctomycetota bacterium]
MKTIRIVVSIAFLYSNIGCLSTGSSPMLSKNSPPAAVKNSPQGSSPTINVGPQDEEEARFLEALEADIQGKFEQDKKIRLKGFYMQRAKKFFYEGNTEKAKAELQKVLELDPLSNEAKVYMSVIETGQKELVMNVPSDGDGVIPTLPEYKIRMNDILDISVWGYDELRKDVTVRPDGRISFPLIGDVWSFGLTPRELDELVTKELSEYVKDPQVAVVVRQFAKPQAVLLGEVRIPGMYDVFGGQRLIEVLAKAGGLTEKAKSDSIFLVHQTTSGPEIFTVSIQDAITNNTIVDQMDLVYVPTRGVNIAEIIVGVIAPMAYSMSTAATTADITRRNLFVAPK